MRPSRPAAAAAAAALLAAAGVITCAGAGRSARGPTAEGIVTIRPDAEHAVASARATPPTTQFCQQHYHIACYQPRQIREAYNLPALYRRGITGRGQTIVIVDSFGSPTVRRDLQRFDQAEKLPAPPSLKIIQPAGRVPPYRPTSNRQGWAGETDLDVEYAHTIAPGASILLVETPTSENEGTTGFPQIVRAEKYVISRHLGDVISQSFSATEQTFPSRQALLRLRSAYLEAPGQGVTVLSASGDSGAADVRFNQSTYYLRQVTSWPDSDPLVTGVGGTQLHLSAAGGNLARATVWNDTGNVPANEFIDGGPGPHPLASGGGKSVIFPRPGYQNRVQKVVGGRRGVPDIAMSAACNGAADMYQSFDGQPAAGTRPAAPARPRPNSRGSWPWPTRSPGIRWARSTRTCTSSRPSTRAAWST